MDNIIRLTNTENQNPYSSLTVKQLNNLHFTRSKISKLKNLKPHQTVQPIKSIAEINRCKEYFLNQETNFRNNNLNIRNYAIFVFNINIGLRAGDLLNLKVSDVLSPTGVVKNKLMLIESKTGKTKIVPICTNAQEAIKMYLNTRENLKPKQYLFVSHKADQLTPNGLWRILKKMQNDLDMNENIGTHSLRKTFGYQKFVSNKQDPYVLATIQKSMNHSSSRVTLDYLGINDEVLEKLYDNNQL